MNKYSNMLYANVKGSMLYPKIHGVVFFEQINGGIMVTAQIYGLPIQNEECEGGVFGFHVHSGNSCTGTNEDPLANVLTHYNPKNCQHPYHAGDLPPLFSNNGYAYMKVLTNRFNLEEIVGKTVVVHLAPDDFTTQPSGNSGMKIACGKIGYGK